MTSLLTEGLVARGHDVTLFATADSTTARRLHAIYPHGYWHDEHMWPWELYEMLNLAAAVERARDFDIIHYEAGVLPDVAGLRAAVADADRADAAPLAEPAGSRSSGRAIPRRRSSPSPQEQARLLAGLNVVGTVLHGIDTDRFAFREQPDDYLLFLGRFTDGKGVLQAIEVARRAGMRLMLAAAEDDYYREQVAPARRRRRASSTPARPTIAAKVKLYGGARALLYPVQAREPFGLVLAEAMACGTPVAALDRGAVREVVDDGVTGSSSATSSEMADGPAARVRRSIAGGCASARSPASASTRMVDEYEAVYRASRGGTIVAER